MIVNHERKYVFVSIPKTSSISMQFSLGYGHDIPEPDEYHQGLASILEKYPEAADYYKFAIVRNPWARLLSLYQDFTLNRVCQYSAKVRVDRPLLSEFEDFNHLCVNLHQSTWLNDIFFRSQTALLSVNGQLAINFAGRFEALPIAWDTICRQVGLGNTQLLSMNRGKYDSSDHRQYYSEVAVEAVRKLYQDDIENFNYAF